MPDTRVFFETFAVLGCVRSVDWSLVADVSGQPVGPNMNGRAVRCYLTLVNVTVDNTPVTLPRTVTPYRDSVDETCDQVTYQMLVTR
jgi:hypothetical protein